MSRGETLVIFDETESTSVAVAPLEEEVRRAKDFICDFYADNSTAYQFE